MPMEIPERVPLSCQSPLPRSVAFGSVRADRELHAEAAISATETACPLAYVMRERTGDAMKVAMQETKEWNEAHAGAALKRVSPSVSLPQAR